MVAEGLGPRAVRPQASDHVGQGTLVQRSQPEEPGRPLVAAELTFRGTWGRRLGATNPAPPRAVSRDLLPLPRPPRVGEGRSLPSSVPLPSFPLLPLLILHANQDPRGEDSREEGRAGEDGGGGVREGQRAARGAGAGAGARQGRGGGCGGGGGNFGLWDGRQL